MEYYDNSQTLEEGLIRLLTIRPRGASGIIVLDISIVSLADAKDDFDAISYMWGAPDHIDGPKHRVWIDGRYITVRENIWHFLRHYRSADIDDKATKLWIDSICINQGDTNEKSMQVTAMGQVFSRARKVLIWLGLEVSERFPLGQDDIDFARRLLEQPSRFPSSDTTVNTPRHMDMQNSALTNFEMIRDRLLLLDRSLGSLTQLGELIRSHPYWDRVWIVQELLVARRTPSVVCGSFLLDLRLLGSLIAMIAHAASFTPTRKACTNLLAAIEVKSSSFVDSTLRSLLDTYGSQQCEDERDRIYGLLGLVSRFRGGSSLQVDYNMDSRLLFLRALDYLLKEERYVHSDWQKLQMCVTSLSHPLKLCLDHPFNDQNCRWELDLFISKPEWSLSLIGSRLVGDNLDSPWCLSRLVTYGQTIHKNSSGKACVVWICYLHDRLPIVVQVSYYDGFKVLGLGMFEAEEANLQYRVVPLPHRVQKCLQRHFDRIRITWDLEATGFFRHDIGVMTETTLEAWESDVNFDAHALPALSKIMGMPLQRLGGECPLMMPKYSK